MSAQVLVAMSAFKGSLTNQEATAAACEGLANAGVTGVPLPIGDGGLGTVRSVHQAIGGNWENIEVTGPDGRPTIAEVLHLPDGTANGSIYLEGAQAFGHHLVPAEKREVMRATSRGVGELLLAILKKNPSQIFIGLGDSAISDVGIGMLHALGLRFYDIAGNEVAPDPNGLRLIHHWKRLPSFPTQLPKITVLCDVLNPLCGSQGSARVFAPQKGASPTQVALIETGMENFAKLSEMHLGRRVADLPMAGSAGGIASALYAFLNAELVSGSQYLLNWIGFDEKVKEAQYLLVGEGKTDGQTLSGKATYECIQRASRFGVKAVLVSGSLGAGYEPILSHVVTAKASGLVPNAKEALRKTVFETFTELAQKLS